MGLSSQVLQVIDKYYQKLIHEIPLADLIDDFASRNILSEYEVEAFHLDLPPIAKQFQLIAILKRKESSDFYQFCQALQSHATASIRQLGVMLQNDSNIVDLIRQEQLKDSTSDFDRIYSNPMDLPCENITDKNFPKWKITAYTDRRIAEDTRLSSMAIGTSRCDVSPKCYKSSDEILKIISSNNNATNDGELVVTDYQSTQTTYRLELPNILLNQILISSDGKFIAYSVESEDSQDHSSNPIDSDSDEEIYNIWEIQDKNIKQTRQTIMAAHCKIFGCRFIANSNKIIVWWPIDNRNLMPAAEDSSLSIESCQIEIWNLKDWHHHQSFQVLSSINYLDDKNGFAKPKTIDDGNLLMKVEYVDQNIPIIVLKYDNLLTYLVVEDNQTSFIDFTSQFTTSLQLLHKCHDALIENLTLSHDHRLIAFSTNYAINIFKVACGGIHSHLTIDTIENISELMFVPDSNHLLTYSNIFSNVLSRYDITGKQHGWKKGLNQHSGNYDQIIVASSCTFINGIPIIALLIRSHPKIDYKVYLTGLQTNLRQRGQSEFKINTDSNQLLILQSSFRESDQTYLFLISALFDDDSEQIIVVKINFSREEKHTIYLDDTAAHRFTQLIYADCYNLFIQQTISEGGDESVIKWYKLGDGITSTQLVKSHYYSSIDDGIAFKITIPISKSADSIKVNLSPLYVEDQDEMIKEWGEKEADLFMFNGHLVLVMKGYGEQTREFTEYFELNSLENLITSKYFIIVDWMSYKILIYDNKTLALMQTIEAPAIKPKTIIGNQEQSLFICQTDSKQYYIIKAL
ncbi:uncharacterized protein TRIADDRAFT_61454 [Trichoplax adhaerens]|uniref:CARD domain-containing protein n=1 Tax=Trichoplax adhaerens TaxID=10228 RepID=B3SB12_TRIAD|nr:predicted protein [Trichoplax adhaerens]EDV20028.1 predicted protein [Trichoplax adhaerens]|eukprot:XP_002117412.1 predicted protein [Trichoplax adhaerens]